MNTHTQLMKSQIQKQLLCFVYHAKFLLSDGLAVYKTGRKTGEGLFLPGGKAKIFGQGTDVRFIQFAVAQRALHPQLCNSL